MGKERKRKLHKNILVAYSKVVRYGGLLHRQSSDTEDGKAGGGFIYFAGHGLSIPPKSGRFLIEEALAKPLSDGLFEGQSQSFEACPRSEFDDFKARYEAV